MCVEVAASFYSELVQKESIRYDGKNVALAIAQGGFGDMEERTVP